MSTHGQVITLAVLTYRRPADLEALLPLLLEQATKNVLSVQILVVDNDPAASARSQVTGLGEPSVRYVHEPVPGIAAARNRALDESAASDVLIFIDDDERPVEGWLSSLLAVYDATHPAGVVGPVISRYPNTPEPWITAGRFFERRRLPTGTVVEVAATNNLLLDLHVVRSSRVRFDEAFGLTGGSDTLFTRELSRAGHLLLWCDEAIVYDEVPLARMSRAWVLQRAYRSGNGWSRTSLALAGSDRDRALCRLKLTVRSAPRIAAGAVLSSAGWIVRSEKVNARGRRTLSRGLGMFSGSWGHVYSEYHRDTDLKVGE